MEIRTVLIIDDQPEEAAPLVAHLEREGYRVLSAASGHSGLEVSGSEMPGVILCDLEMPGLNDYEVLEALDDRGPVSRLAPDWWSEQRTRWRKAEEERGRHEFGDPPHPMWRSPVACPHPLLMEAADLLGECADSTENRFDPARLARHRERLLEIASAPRSSSGERSGYW